MKYSNMILEKIMNGDLELDEEKSSMENNGAE
jgi:hypothetical protein